jgi:hypothetical protein
MDGAAAGSRRPPPSSRAAPEPTAGRLGACWIRRRAPGVFRRSFGVPARADPYRAGLVSLYDTRVGRLRRIAAGGAASPAEDSARKAGHRRSFAPHPAGDAQRHPSPSPRAGPARKHAAREAQWARRAIAPTSHTTP